MDEDQLADLKQFIAATVSQATADMPTKEDFLHLEQKMDDGFAGIGEAIERINDEHTVIDQRLTKLEQQTA